MKSQALLNEQYIEVDGYSIRFFEKGKGPPVLLIHGLGASIEWWQFNLDILSQKYRVIAFDFLGFGLSSKPEIEFNLDVATKFLFSFLDAFNLPRASLIGNSMGGLVALSSALSAPERVENLVLVNNAGFGSELSIFLRLGAVFPIGELALAIKNRITVKMILSQMFYDPKKLPEQMVNCVLEIFNRPQSGETLLKVLRYGVTLKGLKKKIWFPLIEKASFLPHRTLILWGANDRIIPVSQAYVGDRLLKNSQLHIFEKCGHVPQVECPEEFNRAVLDFLES